MWHLEPAILSQRPTNLRGPTTKHKKSIARNNAFNNWTSLNLEVDASCMVHSTRASIELDIFLGLDFLPLFKFPAAHSCLMRGIFRSFLHCLHLKIAKIVCLKWIAQKRPPLYEARNISGTKSLFHGTKAIFQTNSNIFAWRMLLLARPPASFEWKILRFVFTRHFLSMSEVLVNGHQDIWVQFRACSTMAKIPPLAISQ